MLWWWTKCFNNLLTKQGVKWPTLHTFALGMRDPSGYYHYKPTSLTHNFAEGVLDPVFKVCPLKKARASGVNHTNGNHKHQMLEGNAPGCGSHTKLAQVYPYAFCRALIRCILPLGNCNCLLTAEPFERAAPRACVFSGKISYF